jgi:hypothetical protein
VSRANTFSQNIVRRGFIIGVGHSLTSSGNPSQLAAGLVEIDLEPSIDFISESKRPDLPHDTDSITPNR